MVAGLATTALATEQIPDTSELDGQTRPLYTEPLGTWLDDPAHWATFRELVQLSPKPCTGNWRGYRAAWRLHAGRLQLRRLVRDACAQNPPEVPLRVLFPGREGAIDADWYSGTLVVPLGEAGGNTRMGDSTRFPRYALVRIAAGREVERHEVTQAELDAERQRERAARESAR